MRVSSIGLGVQLLLSTFGLAGKIMEVWCCFYLFFFLSWKLESAISAAMANHVLVPQLTE